MFWDICGLCNFQFAQRLRLGTFETNKHHLQMTANLPVFGSHHSRVAQKISCSHMIPPEAETGVATSAKPANLMTGTSDV
jgi:hypothetical protein